MVNCRVKFSGITDPKMILHLRSWVVEFEKDHIPVLSISLSREQGVCYFSFAVYASPNVENDLDCNAAIRIV